MHVVETGCWSRCWVLGAGAVSWLCMWWRQVAGAGCRCCELDVRVVETGCRRCELAVHVVVTPVLARGCRVLGAGGGAWCWVPVLGAGAGCREVAWRCSAPASDIEVITTAASDSEG